MIHNLQADNNVSWIKIAKNTDLVYLFNQMPRLNFENFDFKACLYKLPSTLGKCNKRLLSKLTQCKSQWWFSSSMIIYGYVSEEVF